jgi:serine/threonine protein kinase
MFMDKMDGDLCDAVMDRMFSERDVKRFFYRLLGGLRTMHGKGIIHRDIKLDNIFLADSSDICCARLGDFGHALIRGVHQSYSRCGSKEYSAPELMDAQKSNRNEGTYDTPVDMWSAGVVLYCVLSREFPFVSFPPEALQKAISTADFGFQSPHWEILSGEVKDLIRKLLVVDPMRRLTAAEAMEHPWFQTLPEYRMAIPAEFGECYQLKPPIFKREMMSMFDLTPGSRLISWNRRQQLARRGSVGAYPLMGISSKDANNNGDVPIDAAH